jgi:Anti-sigma-K factor rskA/Putative zinc-finger
VSVEDHDIGPPLCGDNAAPYVLGALGEQEHEAFARHLDSCAVCREEVAALQVVASALPAAAPQLSAPRELKRRVMASVREDLGQGQLRSSSEAAESAHPPWRRPINTSRRPFGTSRRPLASSRRRPVLVSAALAAVVVVLAVIALAPGGGGGGTRVIRAQAPAGADVWLRVSDGHAQLDISGMPRTPPQRVYEVWVKRSGAPQPTDALFTVTAEGDATVAVPGSVAGVKVVMVTAEPLGGTKVPTSSPVIVANVS